MDFADASTVILAERLGHGYIVSTDQRDFGAYRRKNRQPFTAAGTLIPGIGQLGGDFFEEGARQPGQVGERA